MDKARPQSLFVVVSYDYGSPCATSLLQLETHGNNPEFAALLKPTNRPPFPQCRMSFSEFVTHINQKEYVAHFGRQQGPARIDWAFSNLTTRTSPNKLYMVPHWDPNGQRIDIPELHGFIFNFSTNTCRPFKHPQANKIGGIVAKHKGALYFIAEPCMSDFTPDPSFERYDPARDSWDTLQPIPISQLHDYRNSSIVATASLKDAILFNIGGFEIWAYIVNKDNWYPVQVEDELCYSIKGEAVVLDDTIYALTTNRSNFLLSLSLSFEITGGNLVFKCRLLSKILVQGMKPFSVQDLFLVSRHLCLLGKDKFCIVESCKLHGYYDHQPIQLTNIKLQKDKSMTVTGVCGHLLPILHDCQFHVDFCFSLPDSKTTALEEGKKIVFQLNPFPVGVDPLQKNRNLLHRELEEEIATASESGRSSTYKEGRSIHVRNIAPSATYRQLEKELKNFGPVEKELECIIDGKEIFGIVEFEREASKKNAIKASRVVLGGCPAVIE